MTYSVRLAQVNIHYGDEKDTVTTYYDSLDAANKFMDDLIADIDAGLADRFETAWICDGVWFNIESYKNSTIQEVEI